MELSIFDVHSFSDSPPPCPAFLCLRWEKASSSWVTSYTVNPTWACCQRRSCSLSTVNPLCGRSALTTRKRCVDQLFRLCVKWRAGWKKCRKKHLNLKDKGKRQMWKLQSWNVTCEIPIDGVGVLRSTGVLYALHPSFWILIKYVTDCLMTWQGRISHERLIGRRKTHPMVVERWASTAGMQARA